MSVTERLIDVGGYRLAVRVSGGHDHPLHPRHGGSVRVAPEHQATIG